MSEQRMFDRNLIGCYVSMVDGSVRFVSESISPEVLEALATIRGGESITLD